MFDITSEEVLRYIPDYKMNVKTARVISAVTGIEIEAEDYICLYTKR